MHLIEKITAVAKAVRAKTGTQAKLTLDEMAEAVGGLEVSRPADTVRAMATKTLVGYEDTEVVSIGDYAFYDIRTLSTLDVPNVESIGMGAFQKCTGLKDLNFPKCTAVGANAFTSCNGVTSANFPVLENAGSGVFNSMTRLSEFYGPKISVLGNQFFYFCSAMTRAEFFMLSSIGTHAFNQCSKLEVLIIRTGSLCSLDNVNGFANSAIAKGTGYVYVPDSLVEEYRGATNWSVYASQIKPLSELEDA